MSNSKSNVLQFLSICENLKTTKRTGWINHNIPNPESISDHMHRMSIISMLIDDSTIQKDKLIKMAIVHDLAEAIVGDITPNDIKITKDEKMKLELNAINEFTILLNNNDQINEIKELWLEYEEAKTPEALLCKDIDKFEMIVQAFEYEKRERKRLDSFFDSTFGKFKHKQIVALVDELYLQRNSFWNV
ncbi:HD domain-containing protein [Globomyces pollinis-pini]|nr:HD domain-containing protein [Globomyces pollinis-pini]